jgi:hypothetical protein
VNLISVAEFINSRVSISGTMKADNTFSFSAHIECVELINGGGLIAERGFGATPKEALKEYVNSVKGKKAVINAYNRNRFEFQFPETLTVF